MDVIAGGEILKDSGPLFGYNAVIFE